MDQPQHGLVVPTVHRHRRAALLVIRSSWAFIYDNPGGLYLISCGGQTGGPLRLAREGRTMRTRGATLPNTGKMVATEASGPLPGAGLALLLLLSINLFNLIDRQVLAAVEPDIRRDLLQTTDEKDPNAKF